MSITQHGPVCDICGEYILLDRSINPFSVKGVDRELHCHDKCRLLLETGCRVTDLPDGPLRRAYAVQCQQCQAPEVDESRRGWATPVCYGCIPPTAQEIRVNDQARKDYIGDILRDQQRDEDLT